MRNLLNLFIWLLVSLIPTAFTFKHNIQKLRMDERSAFLSTFIRHFFPNQDNEDTEQIITCIGDYEDMGYSAIEGIFKYQMGYTFAEKVIGLHSLGAEIRNIASMLEKCRDQFSKQIEELKNAESHFMHPTSVDKHGHSLIINDVDVAQQLSKCFHLYNVRRFTEFGEKLGDIAT